MGVLLALLEAIGLVFWLLRVGGIALVACLIHRGVADTGVSGHVDGRLDLVIIWVCEVRGSGVAGRITS